ncbi:putative secreted protein [Propionispora sp. 2/2-37]|uniref:hypothetical protein n=1 Tax=Propionispora sp. 2/2-37 TaxID=1677858 RepID=UPI0006BB5F50|nr:hypothetical protein [Propionispora sp. 2/2-37]CUH94458.1 putative secreted protein [Propionispora sp. 2/2-37]
MKIHKTRLGLLVVLLLLVFTVPAFAVDAGIRLTGKVTQVNIAGGFYGIMGDDGVKYQPTNLPHQYRKDGLVVSFTAVPREDLFTSIMWGKVIEVKSMNPVAGPALADAERTAIYVLNQRLEAFNTRDFDKLKAVDTMAEESMLPQQFADWVGNYSRFTLRYVDITYADTTTITGTCVYSRELADTMSLHDDTGLTAMKFTLGLKRGGWKLTQSSTADAAGVTLAGIKQKAVAKYGSDDLSTLEP